MNLLSTIRNNIVSVYKRITNFKFAKITMVLSIILYVILFLSSFLITTFFGKKSFTPLKNLISDMGQKNYSPAPYIFDMACLMSGLFSFPFTFYILKYIKYNSKINNISNVKSVLSSLSIIIGNIGLVGIGIFSMDRNIFYLHFVFASFVLVGYVFAAFYISLFIVIYNFDLPKIIGIAGLFSLTILLSFTFFANFIFTYIRTISEWVLVIFISIWFYSFTISIFFKKPHL